MTLSDIAHQPRAYTALLLRRPDLRYDGNPGVYGGKINTLASMHRFCRRNFIYMADQPGQDEWGVFKRARSLTGKLLKGGDCDDFVVFCLDKLMHANISRGCLVIRRCRTETGKPHLVLAVNMLKGDPVIFDNRWPEVRRLHECEGYTWDWMEAHG